MRKIIHIDMEALYAGVERRDNPEFLGKPLAADYSKKPIRLMGLTVGNAQDLEIPEVYQLEFYFGKDNFHLTNNRV